MGMTTATLYSRKAGSCCYVALQFQAHALSTLDFGRVHACVMSPA
jgi:hypothetical protein